ncbi:benenodin family lasso peptide [Sphingomonas oryzagri]
MTDRDQTSEDDIIDLGAASMETKGRSGANLDTQGGQSLTGLSDD